MSFDPGEIDNVMNDQPRTSPLECLSSSHDLRLSAWGPYTKKYIGISHIPDPKSGIRFDLSVFPGLYRRGTNIPNAHWESGCHPWEAAPDLSYFSFRHEVIWKDQVYCDTSFSRLNEQQVLVSARLVNATDMPQNLALHMMGSLHFPPLRPYCADEIRMYDVTLPEGAVCIDALSYDKLSMAIVEPTANLTPDGMIRGQVRDHGFVNGSGLALGRSADAVAGGANSATYVFHTALGFREPELKIRYRAKGMQNITMHISGLSNETVNLPGSEGDHFQVESSGLRPLASGRHALTLSTPAGSSFELDCLVLAEKAAQTHVRFEEVPRNHVPQLIHRPTPNSLLLKYESLSVHYGIAWGFDPFEVRQFFCSDLDEVMRRMVHDHVNKVFRGPGDGHHMNIFMRPIFVAPKSEVTVHGLVCCGTRAEVTTSLEEFKARSPEMENLLQGARLRKCDLSSFVASDDYLFSQERMAATVLTNIVYPVHTRGTYVRHYSPGRWWDSLYTWDAGFIGLGLAELDTERAIDCLNAYVTPEGDRDCAFIHHGSPVPVQLYLFQELCNRTQSRELLEYFFPRVRQYHRFLAGRHGSSTTRNLKSNLLRTWDYFYNSGGWDDYPPQMHVHEKKMEGSVAPVSNTAHAIRTARILRHAALALGEKTQEFDLDIETFTAAIQDNAWDEESSFFGYVCHDSDNRPAGILRHKSGLNFNMGLDGLYPLVAGICTPDQEERLCSQLMTNGRIWSRWGLSTVDQTAPYYRSDGYWNGAVWMPHQWFLWKALLGMGRADEAFRIASVALEMWKREVDESYNCFEHFMVQTGRGAGWHQFGALSSPVLCWYGSYFRPGRITSGFDMWVKSLSILRDKRSMSAELEFDEQLRHSPAVIATVKPSTNYIVKWNGEQLPFTERVPGCIELRLSGSTKSGTLQLKGF